MAILACAAQTVTHAQTAPFQSAMRSQVGSGFGQQAMSKGATFVPRAEAAVQYVDNINLAEADSEQVSTAGLELAPGFYASYSSDSVTAAIDYSIVGRAWDDSDYNGVSQFGSANGRWIAVPDLFYIDAQGSITDSVINPAEGLNYFSLGLFAPDNLSQQATAGVTPTVERRFGDFDFFAQYGYGGVWYFDQGSNADQVGFIGQDNSVDQRAYVSFGNLKSARKLAGNVFYNWQYTDYQNALPYRFEQVGAGLSWQFTSSTALVGTFGVESDLDRSTTQGGLDSNYWDVGFRWEPDVRTYLEARYGSRFFGHTYFLSAQRTSRMFEFTAAYSESPQVETQILSLGDFNPGELPPGVDPGLDFGRLNSDPYIGKNASAGIAAKGTRTRVGLTGFYNQQDYVRGQRDDNTFQGGTLGVTRDLASNLSVDMSLTYTDYEQSQLIGNPPVEIPSSYYDTQAVGRVNRTSSGGKITTSLEVGYLNRSGGENYDGWWTGLRARWQP